MAEGEPAEKRQRTSSVKGTIKKLINRDTGSGSFGFILPGEGGRDLYFNEHSLAAGMSWADFVAAVKKYPQGRAKVDYDAEVAYGRPRAANVSAMHEEGHDESDSDDDEAVNKEDMATFLEKKPELKDASRVKQQREFHKSSQIVDGEPPSPVADYEEVTKRRDVLFQRQEAEEEELYKQRDAENDAAHRCWQESRDAWDAGDHARSKELSTEVQEHRTKARELKQKAVDLDWNNNEEMFEYVQTYEHEGQARDGTWLDLHGLSVDFALHKVEEMLAEATEKGLPQLEVITGAGNHSGKGGPLIKPKISGWLKCHGFSYNWENNGSLKVTLN